MKIVRLIVPCVSGQPDKMTVAFAIMEIDEDAIVIPADEIMDDDSPRWMLCPEYYTMYSVKIQDTTYAVAVIQPGCTLRDLPKRFDPSFTLKGT